LSGPKTLKKGDILFRENDPSDAMYVIKSGRLAVTKIKGESEITLAELGPGDMIGEMAFFDNKPRSAGARALQDTVIIELPFKALNAQFKAFPEWLKAVVRAVNNHLRNANKKIKELEKSSEEEKQFFVPHMITRLLAIICAVAERYGEPDPEGISVPPGTLRRWTIQVFQLPTNKMQKLNEVLQALGHMKMEDLGEGRMKIVVKNLDLLFGLTDYYTDYLFKDEAKRVGLDEKEMKIARGMIFYAEKTPPNDKGKIKLNLTQIQQDSMRDLSFVLYVDDVNSLIEKGLLSDKMSEEGKLMVYAELDRLKELYPYWEILHALKSVPTRD
jgi:CRP/FNR family transcriptional regulator, cyclic AMP receptor protein